MTSARITFPELARSDESPTHAEVARLFGALGFTLLRDERSRFDTWTTPSGVAVAIYWPDPPRDRVGLNAGYWDLWVERAQVEYASVSATSPAAFAAAAAVAVRIWQAYPAATVRFDAALLAWVATR